MFGWGRTEWLGVTGTALYLGAIALFMAATAHLNPWLNPPVDGSEQAAVVVAELQAAAAVVEDVVPSDALPVPHGTTETPAEEAPAPEPAPTPVWDKENPTLTDIPAYGEDYGVLYIPALGADYIRAIQVGATDEIVDRNVLAVYDGSERAGEVGNLVLAGHREGVLNDLRLLSEGDEVLVRTRDGFYRYTMTVEHIIKPTQVEVLNDVPLTDETATVPLLTLLTCYPDWGNTERRVIVAQLTEWFPASMAGTNGLPA